MLEQLFIDNIVITLIIWTLIYVGDYYLTIYGARLYRANAQDHLGIQGSYELTPVFRNDVDALKMVSVRFLAFVVLSNVALAFVWYLSVILLDTPELFSFLIGALMLREGVIHLRHWRNITTFRLFAQPNLTQGRIEYTKKFSLQLSANELLSFAIFFFLLAITLSSWFVLGGALGCLPVAFQHWRLARKSKIDIQNLGEQHATNRTVT